MNLSMNNIYMRAHNRFLVDTAPPGTRNLLLANNNNNNKHHHETNQQQIIENNNQTISPNETDKTIQEVWSKYAFQTNNVKTDVLRDAFSEEVRRMSWAEKSQAKSISEPEENSSDRVTADVKEEQEDLLRDKEEQGQTVVSAEQERDDDNNNTSPSHHARRPMNAFLIFCKKHRPIVRQKFPNLENRGVTRILGEWWALLDGADRAPYTDLAKEYKDAFLSANPDFKWYKLPAPPLRTLNVRPAGTPPHHHYHHQNHNKIPPSSPVSSPNRISSNNNTESVFTPGKLADESQLGSLTSLMNNNNNNNNNNNFASPKCDASPNNNTKIHETKPVFSEDNNNVEKTECVERTVYSNSCLESPVSNLIIQQTTLPPKPIKKRIVFENQSVDNKNVVRNLMKEQGMFSYTEEFQRHDEPPGEDNMTNQELMDKVVDRIFTATEDCCDYEENKNGTLDSKEVRKLGRQCKGKLYEKFMVEGRLLGNKRDTRLTSQRFADLDRTVKNEQHIAKPETETPNLNHTIKRLAERTNLENLLDSSTAPENNNAVKEERVRSLSETSETSESLTKSSNNGNGATANFNLEWRIGELPSLSYEVFSQRKKDSKKRKNRIRTGGMGGRAGGTGDADGEPKAKITKIAAKETQMLVGSKKRKNKLSITHLEKKEEDEAAAAAGPNVANDLLGLEFLAEVAAHTQKIDETAVSTSP